MIEVALVSSLLTLAGLVVVVGYLVRLARQLAAIATVTSITASHIEQQTGQPIPKLAQDLLDVESTTEEPDTLSQFPVPEPWDLPPRRNQMAEDRQASRG